MAGTKSIPNYRSIPLVIFKGRQGNYELSVLQNDWKALRLEVENCISDLSRVSTAIIRNYLSQELFS